MKRLFQTLFLFAVPFLAAPTFSSCIFVDDEPRGGCFEGDAICSDDFIEECIHDRWIVVDDCIEYCDGFCDYDRFGDPACFCH